MSQFNVDSMQLRNKNTRPTLFLILEIFFLLDECSSDNVNKVTKLYSDCESLVLLTKLENMNVIQLTFIQEHIQRNTLCSSPLGKQSCRSNCYQFWSLMCLSNFSLCSRLRLTDFVAWWDNDDNSSLSTVSNCDIFFIYIWVIKS